MKKFFLLLFLGSFLSMGCAGLSKQLEFTDTSSHALVFGYLDTEKSPCNLDFIEYQQVSPAIDKPYYYMRIDKKAFYREDFVAPGSFKLYQYGGHPRSIFSGVSEYDMSFPDTGFGFSIKDPGKIYFLGSWRVVDKGDFFTSNNQIEPLDHPNELEVLQMILPDAVGSPWEPVIQNAIRVLSHSAQ